MAGETNNIERYTIWCYISYVKKYRVELKCITLSLVVMSISQATLQSVVVRHTYLWIYYCQTLSRTFTHI